MPPLRGEMCGIVGFLDPRGLTDAARGAALRMAGTLVHRGPDDGGTWIDPAAGIALAHRRLSIIDLSPHGRQPMESACGRFVLSYNGEVYNFRTLRRELDASGGAGTWRGSSDTEVMLAAFTRWGVESAVRRFNGMFAFALWDRQERVLHLGRDRMGKKPLFYGWLGQTFLFSSELKALRAYPGWRAEVDRDALALYLRHGYVPAPYSIYAGIRKLLPGALLRLDGAVLRDRRLPDPERYWSAAELARAGKANPIIGSADEVSSRLHELLAESVALRMVSDVPLGALLSGGIDSSLITALMQAQSPRPVKTFSIGFEEPGYDEAPHAKAVAGHLGTDHTELYVTAGEARSVIPNLPTIYDEPFADSSQIPTYLVSLLARREVTVALSGDGGDELFCGYKRYDFAESLWSKLRLAPPAVRQAAAGALARMPAAGFGLIGGILGSAGGYERHQITADRLNKAGEIIASRDRRELYLQIISQWKRPESVVIGSNLPPRKQTPEIALAFREEMMLADLEGYLPDDILVKVDRASMAASLEVRVPLLDHRVVEFAMRVPLALKVREGKSKWLLRQVLYQYVPQTLIERPKMGFGIPLDMWLRGPLRDWAEDLLDESRLRQEGYLRPEPIRAHWSEHLSGQRNWQARLWSILMFQAWWQHQEVDDYRSPGNDQPANKVHSC